MDRYSGKRGAAASIATRKGYNVGTKDADQNVQFCNRIGCHGRIKYITQNTKIASSDKAKGSKPSICSLNENKIIKGSSTSGSVTRLAKSPHLDSCRKLSSQSESDPSEKRSPTSSQSGSSNKSAKVMKTWSSPVQSNIRSRPMLQHKLGSNKPSTQTASPVASVSKSSGIGTLSSSDKSRSPSSSSSGLKFSGKNVTKKVDSCLSRRGRQTTTAGSAEGNVSASTSCTSISRRSGGCTSREDTSAAAAASVRTGRSSNVNKSRIRLSCCQNGRNSSCCREPNVQNSQFPDSEPHINEGGPSLLRQFSENGSSSVSSSYSLSSSNDDNRSNFTPFTSDFSHFLNRVALQRHNMYSSVEMLLALEMIEQDEELTHEQILALETGLFQSSLSLSDQHRDMRLDIDNMSYEELLDLGERIGTVSTALSEESLLKCVRRSVYQLPTPSEGRFTGSGKDGDDVKCSICQEEYVTGDETGKLVECKHVYHITCIVQWLRLKNWCPICKTSAAASS